MVHAKSFNAILPAFTANLLSLSALGQGFPREPLEALAGSLRSAVGSFLGVQIIMVSGDHAVRLSLFEGTVRQPQIATSLRAPLRVFARADPDSTLTVYAAKSGAFVDLAADLSYALNLSDPQAASISDPVPDPSLTAGDVGPHLPASATREPGGDRVSLDHHLVPVSLVSGLSGLVEQSRIDMAVGVLINQGQRPEEALAELRERASSEGVSSHVYAARFLKRLADRPSR